ncbi:MAG: hypothetical protein FWC83_00350 [Alphaproteobacteria bacterium]|nr:hypothetical protein [Alphaproteobacteria bacterium]
MSNFRINEDGTRIIEYVKIYLRKNEISHPVLIGEFPRVAAMRITAHAHEVPKVNSADYTYSLDTLYFEIDKTKGSGQEVWILNLKINLPWTRSLCSCGNMHKNIKQCAENIGTGKCKRDIIVRNNITQILASPTSSILRKKHKHPPAAFFKTVRKLHSLRTKE